MYLPAHFDESRPEVLHAAIEANPFATLIALGASGLEANHLPFELAPAEGKNGTLRAHVARDNPVWRALDPGRSRWSSSRALTPT